MAAGKELFKLFGLIGMQGVETTTKKLKGIDKQARKTQKELDRLGKRAQNVGKVLTKAFTLPLLIVGAAVTKIAADFDEALTTSTAIMGDLSDTMRKDLKNAAIEVSKVVSFTATEAAEAYFFLASAGKTAAQSIGLLPVVAKFAQAGAFNLALATDLLTDAQSALGLSSKDAAKDMVNMIRVSDVLVKANTLANATVAQFSESLTNKAGAALRVLGKDIEEGAAVLAVFADQGLKGAAAGESLNIVMRDFQRASLKNKAAFKEAQVAVFDQNGEMRNMADIVGDLDGLLNGMSDEQRRATLSTLGFQDKSISATMALLGTADAIRQYEKELRSAAGVTDEVAEKQLKTFWKQLGLIKDRLVAVGLQGKGFAEIGNEVILPVFDKIVKVLERASKWWNELDASSRKTAKGFIILMAAVGPTVFVIGKFIAWSKILIPLLVALKTGTLSYAGAVAILQKSVLGITLLIGALVALGWFWFSNWETLSRDLEALWGKFKLDTSKAVFDILHSIGDLVIKGIDLLSKFSDAVPGLSDKLKEAKIGILKFKAAMFADEGRQRAAINTIRERGEATASLTETMKKAVKAGKDALGIKEETIVVNKKDLAASMAAANAAESTEKKKLAFQQDIADQTKKLGADKFALLAIEREQAVAEAKLLGADVMAVKELFKAREQELIADDELNKKEFSDAQIAQLDAAQATELEMLEVELQEKLLKAEELNVGILEIVALYALKEQELRAKVRKEEEAKDKASLKARFAMATKLGSKLNNVLGKFSDNKIQRLDNEEKKQIAAIEKSTMNEEQKEAAILKVQEASEKKRREMQREAAIRNKIFSLFDIAINTARGVVAALATANIPLSIAIGALGLAEGIAVASEPLPFFEGGLISGTDKGVNAVVGEQNQDEVIFPLEKGIGLFVEGVIERLGDIQLPSFGGAPELAGAAGGGGDTVHLHIGTLVADERGLKELERRLTTVRIAENQRKGV